MSAPLLNTTINSLRYPPYTGRTPNAAADLQNLANDSDTRLVSRFATTAARDIAIPTPIAGMVSFVTAGSGGGYPDWCMYDGVEWIWERPTPVTYNSGSISGTSVNYVTPSGHNPSSFTITPSRSGYAEVRLQLAANSGVAGYGSGFLQMRYSSGTLLPGGTGFTVMVDAPAGTRQDTTFLLHPVRIYLTKAVATILVFDLWSFSIAGGSFWQLTSAKWYVTQY